MIKRYDIEGFSVSTYQKSTGHLVMYSDHLAAIEQVKIEAAREFAGKLIKGCQKTFDGRIIHDEAVEYIRDEHIEQLKEQE